MNVDIQTAILGLAVGNLIFGLILLLFQFDAQEPRRIPYLLTGKLLQGAGWLLLAGRGALPDWLSFTAGNSALIVGIAYDTWAMYGISQRPVSRTVRATSAAAVVLICLLTTPLLAAARIAITSFTVMVFFALGGRVMLRRADGNSRLRRAIGWSMWLMAAVLMARGVWAAVAPEQFTLFASNHIQVVMFVALYCLMLTVSFGLLLLVIGQTETDLRASEARFRSYFELPLVGRSVNSPQGDWLEVNDTLCAMLGYARQELTGLTWAELTWPDDLPDDRAQFERMMAGEIDTYTLEKRYIRKDDTPIWAKLIGGCVRNPDRSVAYTVALIEDITARKATEDALRESELRFRLAFDNANSGMCLVDLQGNLIQVNAKMSAIWGYSQQEMAGMNVNTLTLPEDQQVSPRFIDGAIGGDAASAIFAKRYRHRDGHIIYGEIASSLVCDEKGQPRYFISHVQDVTERVQAEAALLQAKEAAEAANRAKSQFLATMSHELRTPLTIILGFSEFMAEDENLTPLQREQLGLINRNGAHLLSMINDVLDMAKIEAGRTTLDRQDVDLTQLLNGIERFLRAQAADKGLALRVACDPAVPGMIHTDAGKLRQVLINLLNNAIKFTAAGSVELSVAAIPTATPDADCRLRFMVQDTGLGIAGQDLAAIFEPFTQVGQGKVLGGTGLGLPISRQFARLLGGDLTAASAGVPGQGSQFVLEIEAGIVAVPAPARSGRSPISPKKSDF